MTGEDRSADRTNVESLCRSLAQGRIEALEALLCLHHRRVLGFLKRKIGVRWQGKIEPEDVLQEAYIEAYKSAGRFTYQGADSFYRWLMQIVEHRFYYQVRHWSAQKRDAGRELAARVAHRGCLTSLLDQFANESPSPSQFLRHEDAAGALLTCIARLPDDYQLAIRRLHLDQAPIATVAAELNRSEDAVRRLAGRAMEKLRECLGRASRFLSRVG